jgi:hypothetical protein
VGRKIRIASRYEREDKRKQIEGDLVVISKVLKHESGSFRQTSSAASTEGCSDNCWSMTQDTDLRRLFRAVLSYFKRSLSRRIVRPAVAFSLWWGAESVHLYPSQSLFETRHLRRTFPSLPFSLCTDNPQSRPAIVRPAVQANKLTDEASHSCRAIYKDAASRKVFCGG